MAKVVARIKLKGKHYEIHVDLDEALKVREGKGDIISALDSPNVFYDLNKGSIASNADLQDAFQTTDIYKIATKIITSGEVQKNQEFRDAEKDKKIKQVITLLLKNAVDQHGRSYTEERLKTAISQTHYNFDNRPAEQQVPSLLVKLKEVIPIRIETKKIKLTIPARFSGQVYGLIKEYKESEEWFSNGDLQSVVAIPSGMLIDFYEKLNSLTHGAVQTEDITPK